MENIVIVSALVKNRRGVLARVSNVFSRRGLNIKQLTVAENTNENTSRITIMIIDDGELDHKQIDKQLRKIEDVLDAVVLPFDKTISKELLLVKIAYDENSLKYIQDKLFESSGKIISFDKHNLIGQIVGSTRRIENFLREIKEFNIIEISRSGVTSLDLENKTFIV